MAKIIYCINELVDDLVCSYRKVWKRWWCNNESTLYPFLMSWLLASNQEVEDVDFNVFKSVCA